MHLKYLFAVVLAVSLGCDGPLIDEMSDAAPAVDGSFEPLDEGLEEPDAILTNDALTADQGLDAERPDAQVVDPDAAAPLVPRTCSYTAQPAGSQEVNTWQGDVAQVTFTVDGLPDPARLTRARLRYRAHDADHPGGEGWIQVNDAPRVSLPADVTLDNRDRDFEVEVSGQTVAGRNTIRFIAFEGPEGAFFRISRVSLVLDGLGIECDDPIRPPVGDVVRHPAPAGISAFAGLAPDFPRAEFLQIMGGLQRPFTALLLDFGPVYDRHNVQMFSDGPLGQRAPNPAHFRALESFIRSYIAATPGATERHLQLYLLNGPGHRQPASYSRAYPYGPAELDRHLRNDGVIRGELHRYIQQLNNTLADFRGDVEIRLVVGLEDNYTQPTANAVIELARDAGWADPVGRNPCGCGFGDTARVGDFHENHPHGFAAIAGLPGGLRAPDSFSNDGWGWTIPANGQLADDDAIVAMAQKASESELWFHLWYDPIQGYPIPPQGPRSLQFAQPAQDILRLLQRGLAVAPPIGDGVERTMNYRQAQFEQRRNWVLDCYDYAYTARFDEHRACDGDYNPDGTGAGRAIFIFDAVVADTYDVYIEGRHTENRNPSGMVVLVNGVEAVIDQRDARNFVWDLHGRHALSGRVEVIIDSTRTPGSDAVRRVRLAPAR